MNDFMNDILNDKEGRNIVNDSFAFSQSAYSKFIRDLLRTGDLWKNVYVNVRLLYLLGTNVHVYATNFFWRGD